MPWGFFFASCACDFGMLFWVQGENILIESLNDPVLVTFLKFTRCWSEKSLFDGVMIKTYSFKMKGLLWIKTEIRKTVFTRMMYVCLIHVYQYHMMLFMKRILMLSAILSALLLLSAPYASHARFLRDTDTAAPVEGHTAAVANSAPPVEGFTAAGANSAPPVEGHTAQSATASGLGSNLGEGCKKDSDCRYVNGCCNSEIIEIFQRDGICGTRTSYTHKGEELYQCMYV